MLRGDFEKLRALFRHKLLVGRYYVFALFQAGFDIAVGKFKSADDLCDDSYLRVVHYLVKILGKFIRIWTVGKIPDIQNILDIKLFPRASDYFFLIFVEQLHRSRAYHSVS